MLNWYFNIQLLVTGGQSVQVVLQSRIVQRVFPLL
jgi:hypothetical protein